MKNHLLPALRITLFCLVFFVGGYTAVLWGTARLAPGAGRGVAVVENGRTVGFENIGQSFTEERYFNSRPSAVGYNAAGSGGSNKGPSNPDYLAQVQARLDTFLVHNPGVTRAQVPVELLTASGSGLDPHLSPAAAGVQVPRIARVRGLPPGQVRQLVARHTHTPLLGPAVVHVLHLNLALDNTR